eukprot:2026513-Heterocapsa_arctica.AAC.1
MRAKVADGTKRASFTASLAVVSMKHEVVWWIENPSSSWLWRQPCFLKLRKTGNVEFLSVDYCRFGCEWRKRTRFQSDIDH